MALPIDSVLPHSPLAEPALLLAIALLLVACFLSFGVFAPALSFAAATAPAARPYARAMIALVVERDPPATIYKPDAPPLFSLVKRKALVEFKGS